MEKDMGSEQAHLAAIEVGLTSKDEDDRSYFARKRSFTPSPAQFERGLLDVSSRVREAFVSRTDYHPTQVQIDRGILDSDFEICCLFINRATSLAEHQITHLISNHELEIRRHLFLNDSIQLTAEHISIGLNDNSWLIRHAIACRKDFVPTQAQLIKGLSDENVSVREVFEYRQQEFQSKIDKLTLSNLFPSEIHKKPKIL